MSEQVEDVMEENYVTNDDVIDFGGQGEESSNFLQIIDVLEQTPQ